MSDGDESGFLIIVMMFGFLMLISVAFSAWYVIDEARFKRVFSVFFEESESSSGASSTTGGGNTTTPDGTNAPGSDSTTPAGGNSTTPAGGNSTTPAGGNSTTPGSGSGTVVAPETYKCIQQPGTCDYVKVGKDANSRYFCVGPSSSGCTWYSWKTTNIAKCETESDTTRGHECTADELKGDWCKEAKSVLDGNPRTNCVAGPALQHIYNNRLYNIESQNTVTTSQKGTNVKLGSDGTIRNESSGSCLKNVSGHVDRDTENCGTLPTAKWTKTDAGGWSTFANGGAYLAAGNSDEVGYGVYLTTDTGNTARQWKILT